VEHADETIVGANEARDKSSAGIQGGG